MSLLVQKADLWLKQTMSCCPVYEIKLCWKNCSPAEAHEIFHMQIEWINKAAKYLSLHYNKSQMHSGILYYIPDG